MLKIKEYRRLCERNLVRLKLNEKELEEKMKEEIEERWERELRKMKREEDYEEIKIMKRDANGNINRIEIIFRRKEGEEPKGFGESPEDRAKKKRLAMDEKRGGIYILNS